MSGLALGIVLLGAGQIFAQQSANITRGEQLYQQTRYEASVALLDERSKDGPTNFLLGRDYLMLGQFKKSTEHLERATAAEPANSEFVDWLGRAYGKRAEVSNPLLAAPLASKARQAFEKAVQLNPDNRDALDDLFDYYLEAPGLLGGGFDKASKIADQLEVIDPGQGHYDKSKLAEKKHQFGTAEQHLRQAVIAAPSSVSHLVNLAKFLANQGRIPESDAVLAQAKKVAPENPRVWFAEANIWLKQNRNLEQAKALLTKYVNAPITADDPPREEAVRLLKQAGGA